MECTSTTLPFAYIPLLRITEACVIFDSEICRLLKELLYTQQSLLLKFQAICMPIFKNFLIVNLVPTCIFFLFRLLNFQSDSIFCRKFFFDRDCILCVDKKIQLDVTFCILYFSSNRRIQKVTSSWFFLSTLNYDARSTTHQIVYCVLKVINCQY